MVTRITNWVAGILAIGLSGAVVTVMACASMPTLTFPETPEVVEAAKVEEVPAKPAKAVYVFGHQVRAGHDEDLRYLFYREYCVVSADKDDNILVICKEPEGE